MGRMSQPDRPTWKTLNWRAHSAARKRRGSLTIWFDPEMTWEAKATDKRGRHCSYGDTAIQTCLTMKVLFGKALRQIEPSRRDRFEPDGEASSWRACCSSSAWTGGAGFQHLEPSAEDP